MAASRRPTTVHCARHPYTESILFRRVQITPTQNPRAPNSTREFFILSFLLQSRYILSFLPLPSTFSNPNPSHYPSTQTRVSSDPKTMVHMMDAGKFPAESEKPRRKEVRVKPELVDLAGDGGADDQDYDQQLFRGFSLSKRPKLDPSLQPYDPLAEPSPLGLKLKKSPSFLDLIQMKLCQEKSASLAKTLPRREKEDHKGAAHMDKLKASNFPATLLRIGTWEYKSRYEGDLVAKCYFAKHKLVWEVLDGGLKNKIEIQWSDIMAIKATCPDDGPETLDVVISRQPLFFREINPQPRKHTLWQATSDFTGGQATVYRRHFVQCSQGLLGKHFEKLIQCDPRLNFLSQQPAVVLDNPYFESKNSVFGGMDEPRNAFDLKTESSSDLFDPGNVAASTMCASNVDTADSVATPLGLNSEVTPSPTTAADICIPGELAGNRLREIERLKLLDQIKVPGFHPSMSMSDLVNHIGQCISEQMTTANPGLSIQDEDQNNILEDIAQYLLSDSQVSSSLDEKTLMSRVDSLCCLLQRDPSVANLQAKSENALNLPLPGGKMYDPNMGSASQGDKSLKDIPEPHGESNARNDLQASSAMSRKDSVGDLLLDLPRIASLPRFLYNLWEDPGAQS